MRPTSCIGVQQRWIFAVMSFLGLFCLYALRMCLSMAITEMTKKPDVSFAYDSETCSHLAPLNRTVSTGVYDWDEHLQGIILSSFYVGYVATHIPGALLAEKFGGKYAVGMGIFLTSVFTVLVPIMTKWFGSSGMILMRVLMGASSGVIFPALNHMMVRWVPSSELARITAVIFVGVDFGVIGATTISGMILRHANSWPAVFYFFGGLGIIWFILWVALCYNDHEEHPFISDKEAEYLRESFKEYTHKDIPPVPWGHIFRSTPFWALVAAHIGHDWGLYTLLTDLPKYLSSVLHFSVEENGYLNALPNLCSVFYVLLVSWLTDKAITSGFVSKTEARKINTGISLVIPAFLVIGASYAGCERTTVVVLMTLGMTFMGSSLPGIKVNSLDLSPNYAGTIMGLANGIASFTGIFTPYLVGYLTPHQLLGEWRIVFWIVFGVFMLTNVIFMVFASGNVQDWNDPEFLNKSDKKSHSLKAVDTYI